MKVTKPTTHLVDIGELDRAMRLPTRLRLLRGMSTPCCVCHKQITDEFMIAGFKQGHPNMMMHEACAPQDDPAVWMLEPVDATRARVEAERGRR
jgi:hypothetical protein